MGCSGCAWPKRQSVKMPMARDWTHITIWDFCVKNNHQHLGFCSPLSSLSVFLSVLLSPIRLIGKNEVFLILVFLHLGDSALLEWIAVWTNTHSLGLRSPVLPVATGAATARACGTSRRQRGPRVRRSPGGGGGGKSTWNMLGVNECLNWTRDIFRKSKIKKLWR